MLSSPCYTGALHADMALAWPTLRRPVFRSSLLLALLLYFVVTIATVPSGTSHFSHVGGLATGFATGLGTLPAVGWRRHRRWRLAVAALRWTGLVALFTSLPLLFYLSTMPSVCCGASC